MTSPVRSSEHSLPRPGDAREGSSSAGRQVGRLGSMTATLWRFSTVETLSEPSDTKSAPLVVVPWSKFGTHRLYVNNADGQQVGWVDLKTGHRSLTMPELASAFEIAVADAEDAATEATDSDTPHRAIELAIELALIAGQASLQARESTPADLAESRSAKHLEVCIAADNDADERPALMRHAYRGKFAYSSWDVGARGKRLVAEELDHPVSLDPRWAYLNSTSVGDHDADVAHLFVGSAVASPSTQSIATAQCLSGRH